jgi:hypothetical protein
MRDQVMKLVAFLVLGCFKAELRTCISGAAGCDEVAVLWKSYLKSVESCPESRAPPSLFHHHLPIPKQTLSKSKPTENISST